MRTIKAVLFALVLIFCTAQINRAETPTCDTVTTVAARLDKRDDGFYLAHTYYGPAVNSFIDIYTTAFSLSIETAHYMYIFMNTDEILLLVFADVNGCVTDIKGIPVEIFNNITKYVDIDRVNIGGI